MSEEEEEGVGGVDVVADPSEGLGCSDGSPGKHGRQSSLGKKA